MGGWREWDCDVVVIDGCYGVGFGVGAGGDWEDGWWGYCPLIYAYIYIPLYVDIVVMRICNDDDDEYSIRFSPFFPLFLALVVDGFQNLLLA
mmetsp:Transcript_28417/g.33676  ORF Transcript_28417/g.33676 Transcript_28417/m.33676 type:complete len:92 (+) Transcript_28417:339-614(+)